MHFSGHHVNQLSQMKVQKKIESETSLGLQCFLSWVL